jgi:hypothetical protein
MYAVLAEDESDVQTLTVLIRRLAESVHIPVRGRGFGGSGDLLKHGARELRLYAERASRFVICHDCDEDSHENKTKLLIDRIIKPSGVNGQFCALVPIKTIESWLIADLAAVQRVFKGWRGGKDIENPETLEDPKKQLERMTRVDGVKPRYVNAIHNVQLAGQVDLEKVRRRCPSFDPLRSLVIGGHGNC